MASVAKLALFPVKSMTGEEVDEAWFGPTGLAGDRAWGVIDRSDGKVASAKNPRKWAPLLQCRARFVEPPTPDGELPPVDITLPDGAVHRAGTAAADRALSSFIGRDVSLSSAAPTDRRFEEMWPDIEGLAPASFVEETTIGTEPGGETLSEIKLGMASPAGTFFDVTVLHVMTEATLDELSRRDPDADFDWRRYRPNVLITGAGSGFVETDWTGRRLRLGAAEARILLPTMRCVMTTLAQADILGDRSTLRAIAAANRVDIPGLGTWACAGSYADYVAAGPIRVGDEVEVLP
jgi:uncharacterized protein YcbX